MKLNKLLIGGIAASLLLAGCASTSEYVNADDPKLAAKNKNRMSSSDWVVISQDAANDLLTSAPFQQYLDAFSVDAKAALKAAQDAGEKMTTRELQVAEKPILMLSTIQNNTGEHIDSKLITERLREVLFKSGKVRFTTYAAGDGQSIDAATAGARALVYDPNTKRRTLKANTVNAYDLSLSGSIIKQTAKEGRLNEISYTFSLTLTDTTTGEGVWTYTKEIKRQNRQGGIGW